MSIKISQFTSISSVTSSTILPVVDPTGPDSYKATAEQLQTFVLSGNASTATNLAASTDTLASTVLYSSLTSVGTLLDLTVTNTINGSINGNAATVTDGVYTTDTSTVTNTMLAGSIENSKLTNSSITINGTEISLGGSGSVTAALPVATASVLGGVKIGTGITVDVDGIISADQLSPATTMTLGGVIIGSGISVDVDGVISTTPLVPATTTDLGGIIVGAGFDVGIDGTLDLVPATSSTIGGIINNAGLVIETDGRTTVSTTAFHGFVVDSAGNLFYTKMDSGDFNIRNGNQEELYIMYEIGTSDYSWTINADGDLVVEWITSPGSLPPAGPGGS